LYECCWVSLKNIERYKKQENPFCEGNRWARSWWIHHESFWI
jgi:hypothetical protein